MAAPTREVLKVEVEHGPLAAELAPFWADVFEVHPKPEMAWLTGILKPDAAWAIHDILTARARAPYTGRSRADELGWGDDWPYELVVAAKGKTAEEARPPPPPFTPPALSDAAGRPPRLREPRIYLPETLPDGTPLGEAELQYQRVNFELHHQSDRGAAVLGGAYVDSVLVKMIKKQLTNLQLKKDDTLFHKLFRGYGPLSTFSARIDIAFAIQLIGKHTYGDLGIIRGIRNEAAHWLDMGSAHKPFAFEDQSIADRCKNLWHPFARYEFEAPGYREWFATQELSHPRSLFVTAVYLISNRIKTTATTGKVRGKPQNLA